MVRSKSKKAKKAVGNSLNDGRILRSGRVGFLLNPLVKNGDAENGRANTDCLKENRVRHDFNTVL